ncbi:hypothetical protein Areg01_34680 [Actinoplanes regularis]|nr:hypothetical protein Areg01_34680 [Actinoplanes regularis]
MGHEFLGLVEETGNDVTTVKPGDLVVASFAYRAMDQREALKVLVRP